MPLTSFDRKLVTAVFATPGGPKRKEARSAMIANQNASTICSRWTNWPATAALRASILGLRPRARDKISCFWVVFSTATSFRLWVSEKKVTATRPILARLVLNISGIPQMRTRKNADYFQKEPRKRCCVFCNERPLALQTKGGNTPASARQTHYSHVHGECRGERFRRIGNNTLHVHIFMFCRAGAEIRRSEIFLPAPTSVFRSSGQDFFLPPSPRTPAPR